MSLRVYMVNAYSAHRPFSLSRYFHIVNYPFDGLIKIFL